MAFLASASFVKLLENLSIELKKFIYAKREVVGMKPCIFQIFQRVQILLSIVQFAMKMVLSFGSPSPSVGIEHA